MYASSYQPNAWFEPHRAMAICGVLIVSAAVVGIVGSQKVARAEALPAKLAPPPVAETNPWALRPVDARSAQLINAGIPLSADPNAAPRPFKLPVEDEAFPRALECLTSAVYYEAANEPVEGQRAVAQVILNRVRHPAYPSSICAVVYQGSTRKTGCQFTFTCDGALLRSPQPAVWARAQAVAREALSGFVHKLVGHATHYHANYVVPYWATSLTKNAVQATHIFYRWSGWWGQPAAFRRRYSGAEPDPRQLRIAALDGQLPPVFPGEHVVTDTTLVLGVDPRVELMSVVQFLAQNAEPTDQDSPYRKAVHDYFAPHSEHLAVQIYRQLSDGARIDTAEAMQAMLSYSAPPGLESQARPSPSLVRAFGGEAAFEGFMTALRDFADHSEFDAFLQERSVFYADLAMHSRPPALALAGGAQEKTVRPVMDVRLILAPLLETASVAGCEPIPKKAAQPWLVLAAGKGLEEAAKHKTLEKLLVTATDSRCADREPDILRGLPDSKQTLIR